MKNWQVFLEQEELSCVQLNTGVFEEKKKTHELKSSQTETIHIIENGPVSL